MLKPTFNAKKTKLYNSRTIKTQLNDSSFVEREKLKIPEFLEARSFEIKSFEVSQLNSKNGASTRVFQSLPRVLRRRAASHNVKRIPKRMRKRAMREMQNTVNGVPAKSEHLRGRKLYRLKMHNRLLKLGGKLRLLRHFPKSDIYGKQINLRSRIKLLHDQIDELAPSSPTLNNSVGSHDNTGVNDLASRPRGNMKYFKRQNHFVWLPTHIWHAKRFHMTKQFGYQIPMSPTQKCFRLMNRHARHSSTVFDTSYYDSIVVHIPNNAHFKQYMLDLTKFKSVVPDRVLQGSKSYNDWIYVDGVKSAPSFIYANIDIGKILIRIFPSVFPIVFPLLKTKLEELSCDYTIEDCRYSLGSIHVSGPTGVNTISKVLHLYKDQTSIDTWTALTSINDSQLIAIGTTFTFDIKDPRFWKRPVNIPPTNVVETINDLVIRISQSTLINSRPVSDLLSSEGRSTSYSNQLSIKQISQKFGIAKDSKNSIASTKLDHSRIPIMISKTSLNGWTMILPWFWVLPTWIKIIGVRNVKVGGTRQLQQYNFENNIPTFPRDYPWLADGWNHNEATAVLTSEKYKKLPSSMKNKGRPDFRTSSILSPFKCDWTSLRDIEFAKIYSGITDTEFASTLQQNTAVFNENSNDLSRKIKTYHDLEQVVVTLQKKRAVGGELAIESFDLSNEQHRKVVEKKVIIGEPSDIRKQKLPVIHVSFIPLEGCKIKDGARVYGSVYPDSEYLQYSSLSLIGFVTSGSFNLNVGHETGIGMIAVTANTLQEVFIRNIGTTTFHRAKFCEIK